MAIWDFLTKLAGVEDVTYGLYPIELRGNWDGPTVTMPETQIPGTDGVTEIDDEELLDGLDFVAVYQLIGSSEQDAEDKLDLIKAAVYRGDVTIAVGNQPNRQRVGRGLSVTATMAPGIETLDQAAVSIRIRCPNPLFQATSVTTVSGASASDLACAQGTAWSRPVITITGASSPLVLTYKSYAGATLKTMTLTFAGTQTVVVDMGARTITVGGVKTDSALSAGDFFRVSPDDGVYSLSHWPTVRASSGSGVAIVYTKQYR